MAKPINFPNGRLWMTQTAALAHFKWYPARRSDNQIVESRSDDGDLVTLLERYDAANTVCSPSSGVDKQAHEERVALYRV